MGIDQDDRVRYLQGSLQGFRGSFTSKCSGFLRHCFHNC